MQIINRASSLKPLKVKYRLIKRKKRQQKQNEIHIMNNSLNIIHNKKLYMNTIWNANEYKAYFQAINHIKNCQQYICVKCNIFNAMLNYIWKIHKQSCNEKNCKVPFCN